MRIYFYTDGTAIKVGQSQDEERRGKELQTGNPRPLTLIGVIETQHVTERWIKSMLSEWRCAGGTEWFRGEHVIDFVANALGTHPALIKVKMKGAHRNGPLRVTK